MSDLIERVARALAVSYFGVDKRNPGTLEHQSGLNAVDMFWTDCTDEARAAIREEARAAIREVAAWLGEQKQFDGDGKGVVAAHLRKQLEETK